jgi:hypothetical protein
VRPSTILDTADLRPSVVLVEDFPTFFKAFDHAFLSVRRLKMARMTDRLHTMAIVLFDRECAFPGDNGCAGSSRIRNPLEIEGRSGQCDQSVLAYPQRSLSDCQSAGRRSTLSRVDQGADL